MLLKEYRICMPLTVAEVSAAPGPASPTPRPRLRGAAPPGRRVHCGRRGNPGGKLPSKPGGWKGRRKWNYCFHLSPQQGGRRWVGRWTAGGFWGGGATRIQIAGDQNAPKGFGRPLLPIKKMNKANPRGPSMPWYLGGQSDLAWAQVPLPLFAGRLG